MKWFKVATIADLVDNSGICVLLAGQQIAIFTLQIAGQRQLYAIDNYDPVSQANVLARGITGSLGERLVVASPLYKQHFDLQNGQCLERPDLSIRVFPVKIQQQDVWLQLHDTTAQTNELNAETKEAI